MPSDAEIARINAEHLISTPLRPADLLFVFGGRYEVDEAVAAAVDLWQRRFFRHAIVSGGPTQGIARTECSVIKDGMVQGGVPAELILEEHCATNTGENVLFSLPVIDAALGPPEHRKRHLPRQDLHGAALPHDPAAPLARGRQDAGDDQSVCRTGRALAHRSGIPLTRVMEEWRKIEPYREKGFIADWP